jgi:polar amino acid transport system substrate-binding protein
MTPFSRRQVLVGAVALTAASRPASAQGQGLLAKLQAAKKVRVGLANQPPFSVLNPDGSISGVASDITKAIMNRLGIPQIEGFIGTYGELIPGMLAGRWDFCSATLTITQARCGQALFADPLIFDGEAIVYVKKPGVVPPTRISDLNDRDIALGIQAGGAVLRNVVAAGFPQAKLRQFASDTAILDGLVTDRVQFVIMAMSPLRALMKARNLDLGLVTPIPDDPSRGASCAFRQQDTDLHGAYQKELRAMKASGEFLEITRKSGFDMTPEALALTSETVCAS